jgi:hypothetical protein
MQGRYRGTGIGVLLSYTVSRLYAFRASPSSVPVHTNFLFKNFQLQQLSQCGLKLRYFNTVFDFRVVAENVYVCLRMQFQERTCRARAVFADQEVTLVD